MAISGLSFIFLLFTQTHSHSNTLNLTILKLKHFFYETASRNEFRFLTKCNEMTKKNEASTKRLILNMDWFGMSKADIIYEWLKTSAAILCRLPLSSPTIKANKRKCKSILISTKLRNEHTYSIYVYSMPSNGWIDSRHWGL